MIVAPCFAKIDHLDIRFGTTLPDREYSSKKQIGDCL